MVEYGSVTAALMVLVSSLAGVFGTVVPSSSFKAAALVSAAARSGGIPSAQAHAAYVRAPYPKPALRYLYAAGWIDAASHLATCKAALVLGPDPSVGATQALQGYPAFRAQLRAQKITVAEAAQAVGRGLTDGCA